MAVVAAVEHRKLALIQQAVLLMPEEETAETELRPL
jgi:hypothetical protein